MGRWYYEKNDQRFGPCTVEEVRRLVAAGVLEEGDPAWPENGEREGVLLRDVVRSAGATTGLTEAPDWLEDVALLQGCGRLTSLADESPDWLEDLRIWYGVESPVPSTPSAPEAAPHPPVLNALTPATGEKALQETGFDPKTGRILDRVRFAAWQRQQASAQATGATTNASLMEVFRQARTALERWVDEEANHALVLQGTFEELLENPQVVHILQTFASYGPRMQEKLRKHFAFLVENRRKYDRARRRRG